MLGVPGEDRRRGPGQERRRACGARHRHARGRAPDPPSARRSRFASARGPGGSADLPCAPRSVGAVAGSLRVHGRRRARAGAVPVLPRHRSQPQAGVRPDRIRRHLRASSGRRRETRDGRQADPGHADPHLRGRRDPRLEPLRLPRLLQESRGHRAGARRRLAAHG